MTHHDRFMAKVRRTRGCWLWTSTVSGNGYGMFWLDGGQKNAHRVAYELLVGPIPEGLQLDHLCRNKLCVNPDHLEPVTRAENKRRDYEARGVCRNGLHPRTPENRYLSKGFNTCLPCMRVARAAQRELRSAA